MKRKPTLHLFLILICVTLAPSLLAQYTFQGTITDDNNETVIGATIQIMGTTIGTTTNLEGKYNFTYDGSGTLTLMTSFIGFSKETLEITLGEEKTITHDFQLQADAMGLDEVIVTGVSNPISKLESSISITTLQPSAIEQAAPRTTAEMLRQIPGIRTESSAGEGNTNITVRGVPISAGGSKYLQLQEDGLPILQFGDIAFGTSDIFLRSDLNVARIEAIRGGSAGTMASNSPAGIINFISKTGAVEGGSVATTFGVDYNTFRTDFEYGSPINKTMNFHVGGFFRQGEGTRTAGYTANYGGQVKANLTKTFDNGYARVYYKYLNDRTAAYLPMPVAVSGTNAKPVYESVPGFDAHYGTPHSVFLNQSLGLGPDGALRRAQVSDGMHPVSQSVGAEFGIDLADGWKLENRGRMSFNTGRFVSPFPAELGGADALAASIGGAGSSLAYQDGTAFGTGNAGNALAMRIHMFDTEINSLNMFANDVKLSKNFNDRINLTLGYYNSYQTISMSWLWNSYMMDVNGENGQMLNVLDSNGTNLSQNGLYAYGVPAWGNCCTRNYDVNYTTTAPYMNIGIEVTEDLTVDASARWDIGTATGSFAGAVQTAFDVNNNGTIDSTEQSVSAVDNANPTIVDYTYNFLSYSVGANYKINNKTAVFARYSSGGAAKADRLLFAGLPYSDGTTLNAKDLIQQAELGYKMNVKNGGLFATAFYAATTEEGGFEATTQQIIENDYQAFGLELEGVYNIKKLSLRGGGTYTNAEITSGANAGNAPRRQPALMYYFMPSFNYKSHSVGVNIIGQTKSYAQDNNDLVMPGYAYLNAFVNIGIAKGLSANLSVNNLANALGFTESEEGSIVENQVNYIRARSITGRTISAAIRYTF